METTENRVVVFRPEFWGQLERFHRFYFNTYEFTKHEQGALAGARNHFYKALILIKIAKERVPLLNEDHEQLEAHGYSPATRPRELSALLETVILELYASVDCTRKIVSCLYKNKRGVPDSTRKLFQNAFANKIDTAVPKEIRDAFVSASWYKDFRALRDSLVHSDTGTCHLDPDGRVFYMHSQLGNSKSAFIIDDIFAHIDELFEHVNRFMGQIFGFLNSTLNNSEVWQLCGIFGGLIYSRYVRPAEAHDFHSGRCDAYKWFEEEGKPLCPLMDSCGAYANRHNVPADLPDPG